jgi:hypothetical protein
MVRIPRIVVALFVTSALALSCSENGGSPADPGDETGTGVVTKTIDPADGTIAATTSNGTSITLDFSSRHLSTRRRAR